MLNLQNTVNEALTNADIGDREFVEVNVLVSGKDTNGETLVVAHAVSNGLAQTATSNDAENYNIHRSLALGYFTAASQEAAEALTAETTA